MSWEIEWPFKNNKSETHTHVCWESASILMNVRRDWLLSLLSFRFTRFSAPPRAWEKIKRGFLFWNINPFLMILNYANCSCAVRITRAIIIVKQPQNVITMCQTHTAPCFFDTEHGLVSVFSSWLVMFWTRRNSSSGMSSSSPWATETPKKKTLEIYEFAKACPHWLNDSSTGQKSPGQEIGPSSMYVTWTTPAGCHVNTEPSNKVQQFSKTPKKTVNNKVIQHWKLKVQLAGSVNEQNTLPSPRF